MEDNNDRELIKDFLSYAQKVLKFILSMESNNQKMRKHVYKLRPNNQDKVSEQLDALMSENSQSQNEVSSLLQQMREEVTESKENFKNEPETRVKQQTYTSMTRKFREVVSQSQNI